MAFSVAAGVGSTSSLSLLSHRSTLDSNTTFNEATAFPGVPNCADERCLFVFHIPREWEDADLYRQFLRYGQLTLAKVSRWYDGNSRGFGFVAFENEKCARNAIREVDGQQVGEGKRLRVSVKKLKDEVSAEAIYGKPCIAGLGPVGQFAGHANCLSPSTSTCFVFHVPSNWDDEEMKTLFLRVGTVLSSHVARKADGSSRGFGFVTFSTPEFASAAIAELNGFLVGNGKRLKVSLKTDSSLSPANDAKYSGAAVPSFSPAYFGCSIFVASFPPHWTEDELRLHFLNCGKIIAVSLRRHPDSNESMRFGFVTFERPEAAQTAVLTMNGTTILGKKLHVAIRRGEESAHSYATSDSFSSMHGCSTPAVVGNYISSQSIIPSYTNPSATGIGSNVSPFGSGTTGGATTPTMGVSDQFHQMGFDSYQFYSSLAGSDFLLGMAGMTGMNGMANMSGMLGMFAGFPNSTSSSSDLSIPQRDLSKPVTQLTQISTARNTTGAEVTSDVKQPQAISNATNRFAAAPVSSIVKPKDERTSALDSGSMDSCVHGASLQQPSTSPALLEDGRWDVTSNMAAMQQLALMQQWQQQQPSVTRETSSYKLNSLTSAIAKPSSYPLMSHYSIPNNLYAYPPQNLQNVAATPADNNLILYGPSQTISVTRK